MIKIIKDGQKDFIAKCPTCGAKMDSEGVRNGQRKTD